MPLSIRPVRQDDIPALGRICFEAFGALQDRHAIERDFDSIDTATMVIGMCASRPDFAGFVALDGDRIIGSNFLCFSDADNASMKSGVAGVGPITIAPDAQSRGVGRALMSAVLNEATRRGIQHVRLLQEAVNTTSLSLYTKLGFDWKESCALVRLPPADHHSRAEDPRVAPVTAADLPAIADISARHYGSSRRNEAAAYLNMRMPGFILRQGATPTAYFFPGLFGHGFAASPTDMAALITHAALHTPPMFQRFLLPLSQNDLNRQLMDSGCRAIKLFNYMSLGPYRAPTGAWLPAIGM